MIRNMHPVVPAAKRGGFHQLLGAALLAAAAVAAPAHAGVIGFEGDYTGMVLGGDVWNEAGYSIGFFANLPDNGIGSLVGQLYDGNESSCDTSSQLCPPNTSGTYYAALNDAYLDIMFPQGAGFKIKSFDASFVGSNPSLASYPAAVGLVSIVGIRADGSSVSQDFWFDNPNKAKNFQLTRFTTSGEFADSTFVEALVYGFACNNAGNCQAFQTDKGQFAIDNITTTDVPEPATLATLGAGLLGLAASRRRRKS